MIDLVLLLHAATTVAMCGLIWFVQIVHYPLFAAVGGNDFRRYERAHVRRTGRVVGPLMSAEGITAIWLAARPPAGCERAVPLLGVALLLLIWGATAFLLVPTHRRLEGGFSPAVHLRLLRANWIRTILWTLRALLALWMVRPVA